MIAAVHATPPPAIRVSIDRLGVVSTMIDGKGPFHFMLDTGAGIVVLSPEFAARAGIAGNHAIDALGTGGSASAQQVELAEVNVGGAKVQHVSAAIIPLPYQLTYQGAYGTIDGIIGETFLSHFATTIDLAGHAVTFASPDAYVRAAGAVTLDADFTHGTPVVPVTVDGRAGHFQIDTGSNGTLDLTTAFVDRFGFLDRYKGGVPEFSAGVGGSSQATTVRLASFGFGGVTFAQTIARLWQTHAGSFSGSNWDGNIGTNVLKHFTFTVDPTHGHVDLIAHANANAYEPDRQTGMLIERAKGGNLRVIGVLPGTPAAKAGIAVGDIVTRVNGAPAGQLDVVTVSRAGRAPSVRYTVASKSGTRDVTLKSIELLPR